jgi:phosphatidylinositol alpha-1,6-mannosyltransferase
MPSILLVTNDFGPRTGGIETFIIGLLERMPRGEVIVYTSKQVGSESFDKKWLENFGVKVIRDSSKILLPTPGVIRAVRRVIKHSNIEKIWFGAAAPLAISARFLRVGNVKKIVALSHGHEVWWSKVFPFNFAMKEISRSVDVLTFLGDYTGSVIGKHFKNKAKLVKIAPGIDINHFKPEREPSKVNEVRSELKIGSEPLILSVGRLVHRKGQDKLITAMPKILAKRPDTKLLFIGQGPRKAKLDSLVAKYGIEDSVIFLGSIAYTDLPKYLNVADLFVMPSRSRLMGLEVEGLGIVYLEASACALPIIAGSSGGAPDALLDGKTGYVVDGMDIDQIANRVLSLIDSPKLAKEMGEAGRAWVESNWSWDIWSSAFNELLEISGK